VVWSNGATYTGQFLDGKYHGLGVYVWPSGKKFVGRWSNGVKNGHGLYSWPNGKKYDGEYKIGLKDGYGRMTWPDGTNYCGKFRRNKRSGRGVQTGPDGKVMHCGEWKDDEPVLDGNGYLPEPRQEKEDYLPSGVPQNVTVDTSREDALKTLQEKTKRLGQRPGQFSSPKNPRNGNSKNEKTEPEHDICSPQMFADLDDEEESCDLGGIMGGLNFDDEMPLVKIIAPMRLVV
jgi:hypothetical protein